MGWVRGGSLAGLGYCCLLLVVADDGFPIGGRRNEKREEGKCGG